MAEALVESNQPTPAPKSAPGLSNIVTELYTGVAEETFFKSPLVPQTFQTPYNSDDLWQRTGDYRIYEEMVKDDQVSVCLKLKKDLVIGSGYDFIAQDESQNEIVQFLESSFMEDPEAPLEEQIEEVLTGYDFGFSLSEKVFKVRDDGKLALKVLKTRHPNSWLIYQDDRGNILKYEQNTSHGLKEINPQSLIHYVNNRRFQNPYGTSDLRFCYNAWFVKRQVIKYFAMFLENAVGPKPVAKYHKDAPEAAIQKLFNSIKNLQAKTALTIPKEIDLEYLETKSAGEAYERAINIFNMMIGRALFVPDLVGLTGSQTSGGSYSLGKEQMNMFFIHINRRRKTIERLINKHLVWPIVAYNFGYVENYPKFRFKPIDDEEAKELAKVWLEAVNGKLYKPSPEEINHFRKMVQFPEGDVEYIEQIPDFGFGALAKQDRSRLDNNDDRRDDVDDRDEGSDESQKKSFGKVFDQVPGNYHKKVNFKAIETKLNDYDQSVLSEAAPVIKKIFSDLYDQIEKKKIIKNQDISRIDSISLKHTKELKQILKASLIQLYKDAQAQASQEIFKSNFRLPLASDKFLEILENEVFAYIGDWQYSITKRVRAELVKAVKDGRPLSVVFDVLDDEGKRLATTSLERFARTKHTEVLNKGRHAFFEDSGVVSGYQYSAILDDRTSPICRGLHGKKFRAGTEPVPPMHFNCRSVLIPITRFEEFTPDDTVGRTPISQFIEENVGEGFAVR